MYGGGGKHSKDRLTLALTCSMTGEFDTPLVIGKSTKPHAFRNLRTDQIPVTWRHNEKAWMTSQLFTEWLQSFNAKMRCRRRKALLFVDNAPSHPHDSATFSHVKVVFLPATTTSVLQPLDQGIIQNVKQHYIKRVLRKIISDIDNVENVTKLQGHQRASCHTMD